MKTELSWGYHDYAEVKRNAFKKYASSWLSRTFVLLRTNVTGNCTRNVIATKARGTPDEVFWTFSLSQHSHSSEPANAHNTEERQF